MEFLRKHWEVILGAAACGLLIVLGWGCQAPNTTSPDQGKGDTQTQVTTVIIGASPSPGGSCLSVNKTVINSIPAFNHVGGSDVLGFTTFDVTGAARNRQCDQASTESWTTDPPGILSSLAGLNPTLTASAAGQFPVQVCVDQVCDGTLATAN